MRVVNRILAFLLAAALLAASVLVIVEVIAYAVNAKPALIHWTSWYDWANRTPFKAGVVRFWSIVLIVAGLLLVAVELRPRRVSRLAVASEHDATDAAITRRGLAGALRNAATSVDGVTSAAVAVRRRTVSVTATAAANDRPAAETLRDPVNTAVQSSLNNLQLRTPPRVSVQVNPRSA